MHIQTTEEIGWTRYPPHYQKETMVASQVANDKDLKEKAMNLGFTLNSTLLKN